MEYLIEAVTDGIRKLSRRPQRKQLPFLISAFLLSTLSAYSIIQIGILDVTISAHAAPAAVLSTFQKESTWWLSIALILPFATAVALALYPAYADTKQSHGHGTNRQSALVLFLKRYILGLVCSVIMTVLIVCCFLVAVYTFS